jgi:hypothetical protein
MADKPILFTGPMVRALLDGRKTMTRRVLDPQPVSVEPNGDRWYRQSGGGVARNFPALPYVPGDRLWVKETHWRWGYWEQRRKEDGAPGETEWHFVAQYDPARPLWFAADDPPEPQAKQRTDLAYHKRPSIYMPRWASRLTLEVTDVKVERVQDISEADARAEGIERQDPTPADLEWFKNFADENGFDPAEQPMQPVWLAPGTRQGYGPRRDEPQWGPTPEFAFRLLWDSLNANRKDKNGASLPYAWADNPWIVALTFDVHRCNIDAMDRA